MGHGENVVHLVVAINHGHGVIGCEQCKNMNGAYIVVCLKKSLVCFQRLAKVRSYFKMVTPNQNSAAVRKGMHACNAVCLNIPNRSSDLNPITNLFHLVNKQISEDAKKWKIELETYEQFLRRVIQTIKSYSKMTIDLLRESMHNRLGMIMEWKGECLRY